MAKVSLRDKVTDNELDLSMCLSQLGEIPVKEMASMTKVTRVDLSRNLLSSLPNNFGSLIHIVHLDLSKNCLTELPQSFGNLHNLQHLDLWENKLSMLPVSFARLKSLKWLDLKNNPLDPRLKAVAGECQDEKQCQKCAKQVVAFMKTVESELERVKQQRLKKEREAAAENKAAEEKEKERQRQQKKAEREKRKLEHKMRKEKIKQQEMQHAQTESYDLPSEITKGSNINGEVVQENVQRPHGSWLKHILLLLVFIPIATVLAILGLAMLDGHRLETVSDAQEVLVAYWDMGLEQLKDFGGRIKTHGSWVANEAQRWLNSLFVVKERSAES